MAFYDVDKYHSTAMKTEANQETIAQRLKIMHPEELVLFVELNNAVRGLSDEVGELNSALKKWIEYNAELDRDNIKEEIGDCYWRLSQACKALKLLPSECMEANIRKLQDKDKGRYKNGYSDEAAQEESRNRIDEASCMRSTDELTQEDIDAVNGGEVLIQNGHGWAEPPEENESEKVTGQKGIL